MKKTLLLATILPLVSGCASIVGGAGDQSVRLNSTPAGAKVTIVDKKGKEVCTQITPGLVSLRREHGYCSREKYSLKFELAGYEPGQALITSRVTGWYPCNLFFGGLIGMIIVDPATGAMWTLGPRDINVSLTASP